MLSGRIWATLALGFTLLILLIVLTSTTVMRETLRSREQLSAAYERHYKIADALAQIRSDLYLAGILKRDFLLDPAPSHGPQYGQDFGDIKASTDRHLRILQKLLTKQEAASLAGLRTELQSYMRPLDQALDWEPILSGAIQWQLLKLQLRQRGSALRMAADLEDLNARDLAVQQDRTRASEAQFRGYIRLMTIISVSLGLLVAGLTVWHMRRLELQSERAHSALRHLSHQLVKVQEQERRRISRELHDEVGQLLTGLRMELANMDCEHARGDPVFYRRLIDIKEIAEQSLRSVRNLAMLLRPSMLDDLGLTPALRWQTKEFTLKNDVPVELSTTGDLDGLSDDLRTCIYRVVQEALTNACRHAEAKHVKVAIERNARRVLLAIEDDGRGFDHSKARVDGIGLVGMEERVREIGGRLEIRSHQGRGTRIRIELPLMEKMNELSSVNSG